MKNPPTGTTRLQQKLFLHLIRGEVIEGKEPGEKYTTGDYTVDEKHRSSALTEEGVLKVVKTPWHW